MASAEKRSSAAAACLAAFSLDVIYGRASYIHELSCGQVGAHLYSRMCCAVFHCPGMAVNPRWQRCRANPNEERFKVFRMTRFPFVLPSE
ncbi:hypothetical protein AOLI_G00321440 [Acnodon oligacanthus]